MPRMTGGDAIVDSLLRHGVDTIFGLPGVQMYGLFDAFARNANRLKVINARHEQTTAYMALGYAQSSGKPLALQSPLVPWPMSHPSPAPFALQSGPACGVSSAPMSTRQSWMRSSPSKSVVTSSGTASSSPALMQRDSASR